jgi:hypothetical protein
MRFRLFAILLLGAAGFLSLSLLQGQQSPIVPGTSPTAPAPAPAKPAQSTIIQTSGTGSPGITNPTTITQTVVKPTMPRDLANLTDNQKQVLASCRRGADFLVGMARIDGRFRNGYVPSLGRDLEGDNYLRQVGAAFALARAARLTGETRYEARATLALLALLDDTTLDDPKNAQERHTTLPSVLVNRLGSAGLLVLAINELPAPQADLLEKSDQLCNYIRKNARTDGSLGYADAAADGKPAVDDPNGINDYPGTALYALMVSQRQHPAPWKTDIVRKAVGYYQPWWRKHKSLAFIPLQTAAYAEAYVATKDQVFADCVNEMNEYLCDQQYTQTDQAHPEWRGGFHVEGQGDPAPTVGSAAYAESLAQACRVARQAADVKRFDRYSNAAGECVRFLALLQYTDGNTGHFEESYRKRLLGGFFASNQDGNLRLDYTQHAISALTLYLEHISAR